VATQSIFTTAPTADVSYIDGKGALHTSTFATKPVDPNATLPVKKAEFISSDDGTYPITAQTLGADIANAYISFINNGNVGVIGTNEAMKLAGDLILSPASLGSDLKSLSAMADTIGKILGGNAKDASYITQIVQADLAVPVPNGIRTVSTITSTTR
jgi:hypothetical protein